MVATRPSPLAMAQTRSVIEMLGHLNPDDAFELVKIRTGGDTDQKPLFEMDRKGIFEKEIDAAVYGGEADFAVHSLKDVPNEIAPGLAIACIPERAPAGDVLVSVSGRSINDMARGAAVGTSSLRRAVQARRIRPDLEVKPVRGNVGTRISKLGAGYDALILAEAGIMRLNLDVRYSRLGEDEFIPAPGQGSLAAVARTADQKTIRMLEQIQDADSRAEADAERALSESINSGCRFPVGARAHTSQNMTSIRAEALSYDGRRRIYAEESGTSPSEVGRAAGEKMRRNGMDELALDWRQKVAEWNR